MHNPELTADIQYLPGVGPGRAELLRSELNVHTLWDLLRLYPYRYVDRGSVWKISSVTAGESLVQVQARVISSSLLAKGGKLLCIFDAKGITSADGQHYPMDLIVRKGLPRNIKFNGASRLGVMIDDGTGRMEVIFFKGIKYMFGKLVPGQVFLFFGKPSLYAGRLNMVHPEVDSPLSGTQGQGGMAAISGVYPSTEKLKNSGVTGRVMNKLMLGAMNLALSEVEDPLPEYVLKENNLVPLQFALYNIHFPGSHEALSKATRRLKFEELFFLQLSLLKQKYIRSRGDKGFVMSMVGEAFNKCYSALPYDLTGAQKRVIREIREDMRSGHQMNRLLQGDVGSGKTIVAMLSSLIAIGNGYQVCLMAPTEVLAMQHFETISRYMAPTGVRVALLTGSSKTAARREIHAGLIGGSIGLIVGTHALIEDTVEFKALGLAIVDEQHRFGVDQRARLWGKAKDGLPPHVLVMTATPIPRTLAMTLYGDLDVSVIDEMPPGRKPVQTFLITDNRRASLNKFMREQIALGRQIFVVYPLIFESEKLDYKNLEQGYEQMVADFPQPDYSVALVHGQQSAEEKNFNMAAFVAGRANILMSTTVIEVGVDVPNASVMVIESAERFGLSQLHQLRGRVGRGSDASYCVLVCGYRLSRESKKRLDLLCSTEDGFVLAEEDMKMRGPGDLSGTMQSGLPVELNIASLATDGRLLAEARDCAARILDADPTLSLPQNLPLARELRRDKYQIHDYSKIS